MNSWHTIVYRIIHFPALLISAFCLTPYSHPIGWLILACVLVGIFSLITKAIQRLKQRQINPFAKIGMLVIFTLGFFIFFLTNETDQNIAKSFLGDKTKELSSLEASVRYGYDPWFCFVFDYSEDVVEDILKKHAFSGPQELNNFNLENTFFIAPEHFRLHFKEAHNLKYKFVNEQETHYTLIINASKTKVFYCVAFT